MFRHMNSSFSGDPEKIAETGRPIRGDRSKPLRGAKGQSAGTKIAALPAGSGESLPQLVPSPLPFRRTVRRAELRQIVPLGDTTIYEMERRGEFPRRFYLTSRCVVWDLVEVEAWVEARREAANAAQMKTAPSPDVRRRKLRPVKAARAS